MHDLEMQHLNLQLNLDGILLCVVSSLLHAKYLHFILNALCHGVGMFLVVFVEKVVWLVFLFVCFCCCLNKEGRTAVLGLYSYGDYFGCVFPFPSRLPNG